MSGLWLGHLLISPASLFMASSVLLKMSLSNWRNFLSLVALPISTLLSYQLIVIRASRCVQSSSILFLLSYTVVFEELIIHTELIGLVTNKEIQSVNLHSTCWTIWKATAYQHFCMETVDVSIFLPDRWKRNVRNKRSLFKHKTP